MPYNYAEPGSRPTRTRDPVFPVFPGEKWQLRTENPTWKIMTDLGVRP